MTFEHWITPGTYVLNPALEVIVLPLPTDRFRAGDMVRCVKTFVPLVADGHTTKEGQEFTVRAYLRDYDYIILEEFGEAGYQNAARFEVIS